jgi:ArsR family transcriptional regulator
VILDIIRGMTTRERPVVLPRLQALAEETRLRIVELLADGERCVCELQAELGAAQPRLSFHLRRLKEAGMVTDRREGRWVYYALNVESVEELRAYLEALAKGAGERPRRRLRCG